MLWFDGIEQVRWNPRYGEEIPELDLNCENSMTVLEHLLVAKHKNKLTLLSKEIEDYLTILLMDKYFK
jgi:hypothetical protein